MAHPRPPPSRDRGARRRLSAPALAAPARAGTPRSPADRGSYSVPGRRPGAASRMPAPGSCRCARPPSLAPDSCLGPAHGPLTLDPHSCVLTRIPAGRRPLHCRPPSAFREACWSGPLIRTYQFFLPFCGARNESRGRCSRHRLAQAWETLQKLVTTATATAVRPSRAGRQQPHWQTADLTATDDGLQTKHYRQARADPRADPLQHHVRLLTKWLPHAA